MIKRGFSTDTEIWNAFREGSEAAYELIFKENYSVLIHYGLRFSAEREEVKDCVQQLFAGLWESRKRLGENHNIRSYLLASIRRMIHRHTKRKPLIIELTELNPKFHLDLSVENQYLRGVAQKEEVEHMTRLLNILPGRQKEALYLRYYGDQGFAEIAEVMGISTRAVYKLIYKATARLASELDEQKENEKSSSSLAAS